MEIKRGIYKDLCRELEEPQVLLLTGPRQVGKTTLLRALEAEAHEAGKTTRYLDLEQPADLAALRGGGLEALKDQLERDYIAHHFRRLGGRTEALARFLGLGQRQLYRRCARLGILLRKLGGREPRRRRR